jgi:hypothetical protein
MAKNGATINAVLVCLFIIHSFLGFYFFNHYISKNGVDT